MHIEVGEYVRSSEGIIAKCIEEKQDRCVFDRIVLGQGYYKDYIYKDISERANYIKKHSPNIIDLIEVGDFVKIEYFSNRYSKRVKRIFEVDCIIDKSVCFTNGYYTLNILNGEWANQDKEVKPIIKSIVTKEVFYNAEYRVETN